MGKSGKDISVLKLINYNLVFFIPLVLLYIIANYFSGIIGPRLEVSPAIATQIIMAILSLITFFVLIPFLRIRETVKGVRFSLFNFIVMGFVITIPSLLKGNYGILMSALIYLANFIFATFINSPDVIGISGDPEDWFKHKVQIMIFLIYLSIVLLYVMGFSWIYFQMANDTAYPNAFRYESSETPSYMTFTYYSIVSMATVGYGDITPLSAGARFVMGLQILLGMIINVVFIAILLMYISFSEKVVEKQIEKKLEKEEQKLEEEESMLEREEKKLEREEIEIKQEEKKLESLERGQIQQNQQNQGVASSSFRTRKYPNYMNGYENRKQ